MFGICNLSVIPVRKESSDTSEMVTQLLFGEHFEILERKDPWRRIRIAHDGYEGWLDAKQMIGISDDEARVIEQASAYVTLDLVQIVIYNQTQMVPVVSGSTLPRYNNKKFKIGETEYSFDGTVRLSTSPDKKMIIESAYMYMNSPYLWGGRSPFGIDCSGFTQVVYKLCGMRLKRDASQQAEQGITIKTLEESMPGDLAFFNNDAGKITHVGILLPQHKIIHASGKVRVDKIDPQGIFNEEKNSYSHNLRLIKRIN
jgi:gamma-D-glutamyl-L-lysine dipeptidyl-peptidase